MNGRPESRRREPSEGRRAFDASPEAGPQASRCPHCGAPVEAERDEFCCHGCELAWTIIHGAGLARGAERPLGEFLTAAVRKHTGVIMGVPQKTGKSSPGHGSIRLIDNRNQPAP